MLFEYANENPLRDHVRCGLEHERRLAVTVV